MEECFAANNMDHVLRAVAGTLAADLGMGDALAGIEDRHGGLVADACKKTARTLVRNAAESVEHQVSFLSKTNSGGKMFISHLYAKTRISPKKHYIVKIG